MKGENLMKNEYGIEQRLAAEDTAKVTSQTWNGFYIRQRTIRKRTKYDSAIYRYDICHNDTLLGYNYFTYCEALRRMLNDYVNQTVERPLKIM